MGLSVFDHPWLSGLFSDDKTAVLWSAEAQLAHMLRFEAAWSRSGHLVGLWSEEEGETAARIIESAHIPPDTLGEGTGRDGVCVPALVRQLKTLAGDAVHRGATSQDVIDSALALAMVATAGLMEMRLDALDAALAGLEADWGAAPLSGRTRMQVATGITVGARLASWRGPIADHKVRLAAIGPRIARVQIGGASGDRAALGHNAEAMVEAVAGSLGLVAARQWHARRDGVGEFGSILSLISGHLGKIGQDAALMAQQGLSEVELAGGGGSSAMPHKQNPVLAELLVTLARFNAAQLGGLHQALVHEQERSGAAWALEWMILPQMALATGRALAAATTLCQAITRMGTPL